ncbi:uncharacterized protein LOC134251488, partial [Saccostrea cucullata]|uniref:uncharacterized protein LOC134251488 n=1 Tax=Saccostrea cuccullata TaxID=36930 RepID=UPI002ED0E56F
MLTHDTGLCLKSKGMDDFVDSCPSNLTEVIKATLRLGCGQDKYGNDQYICLPNIEKTGLVELCHNGIMGFIEKGNCLETSEGKLFQRDCSSFVMGCPDYPYRSNKIFNYSACQKINTRLNCYISDSSCVGTTTINTSTESFNVGEIIGIVTAVIFTLIILTVITIIISRKRLANRRKRGLNSRGCGEEDVLLTDRSTTKELDTVTVTETEKKNSLEQNKSKSIEEQ